MGRTRNVYIFCCLTWLLLGSVTHAGAQGCPPNIGFEKGDFTNWETLTGSADSVSGIHLYASGVEFNRHKIYKDTAVVKELDAYGRFPVNCPNGSGSSIRLGNNLGGAQAEGVNYTFTIPADKNTFSLIYYYAVVMQNPPHAAKEQPKFTAKVFNVTTGQYITCSSFEYIAQQGLPGFQSASSDATVLFKDWTPVTIKLNALAGNTIRLEFATNDCTRGGHFGYAYVDVDENCLSPILGNIVCQYDTVMRLTAPYGFASYRWFNGDFSQMLGKGSEYKNPVIPPDNTEFAVELTPYPNQGCPDTVFTKIHYSTESIVINTPQNAVAGCIYDGINVDELMEQSGSSAGLLFSVYLDPALTQHVFNTDSITKSGRYYVKGLNDEGCFASKPIDIIVNETPAYTVVYDNKPVLRPATMDLTKALSAPGTTLTYWSDAEATIPLSHPESLEKDGTYYVKLTSAAGCSAITAVTVEFENPPPAIPNAFSPNGDGLHDTWRIDSIQFYPEAVVDVFTRSGQRIFHASGGYGKPWDGRQNGKDVPQGTYYYVIRLTRQHPPIGGSVTILR